ncbi:DUF1499 domain-containing protein [Alkalicoccus halolimnae]|uniref:DUF1499 domain-containing protein n=1 Tax=Alkalicoccus halolimnae TaxID=1667239 RepID=A0A5C7FCJ9_9BACI|nr:DUF1499 domain-containing protein [Alkalicoccus halolimnae]TXF85067.1 DUF1499 domain-containing protein [Alkalicoccus halolimnae]
MKFLFSTISALLVSSIAYLVIKNNKEPDLGVENGMLAEMPPTPNAVSSQASGGKYTAPFPIYNNDPQASWNLLIETLINQDRTEMVAAEDHYAHVVFHSPVMKFKDDTEFYLNESSGHIDVRSGARVGCYDMDVNRKRVEALRKEYTEAADFLQMIQ